MDLESMIAVTFIVMALSAAVIFAWPTSDEGIHLTKKKVEEKKAIRVTEANRAAVGRCRTCIYFQDGVFDRRDNPRCKADQIIGQYDVNHDPYICWCYRQDNGDSTVNVMLSEESARCPYCDTVYSTLANDRCPGCGYSRTVSNKDCEEDEI